MFVIYVLVVCITLWGVRVMADCGTEHPLTMVDPSVVSAKLENCDVGCVCTRFGHAGLVNCSGNETWVASSSESGGCSVCCECDWYTDGLHVICNCDDIPWIAENLRNASRLLSISGSRSNSSEYKQFLGGTPNVRELTIRHFTVDYLTNILDTLTQLEVFDMGVNRHLIDMDSNIFQNLTLLRKLRFSNLRNLPIPTLQRALNQSIRSTQIDTLVIDFVGPSTLSELTADFFLPFRNSMIKKVVLTNLNIARIEFGVSKYIKSITCVILSGNGFTTNLEFVLNFIFLPNIKTVDFSSSYTKVPGTPGLVKLCSVCDKALSDSTKVGNLSRHVVEKSIEQCENLLTFKMPSLEYIYIANLLDSAAVVLTEVYSACIHYDNHIRYADISYFNQLYKMRVHGLLRLQYLNAQSGGLTSIPCEAFCNFPSLETLLLGHNKLGSVFETGNATHSLTKLSKLSSIDLSTCEISLISRVDFQVLSDIKFVNLSNNKLTDKTLNYEIVFNFHFLNLSHNSIEQLPEKFRKAFDKLSGSPKWIYPVKNTPNLKLNMTAYSMPIIDLSNNPFVCSCDTLAFLRWFRSRLTHFHKANEYICDFNSSLVPMHSLNLSKIINCQNPQPNVTPEHMSIIGPVVGGTVAMLLICVITAFSYRYKHQLKYYLYFKPYLHMRIAAYKRHAQPYRQLVEENVNEYDVFIIHSGDDLEIVRNYIKPGLLRRGFTVTTSEDDFIPGRPIPQEIEKSLSSSTCALLLLSTNFLHSPWLDYEVTMAIALKRKVIMVKLDDPPHRRLTPALLYLYNNNETRQRYPKDRPRDLPKFWKNLAAALMKMKTARF